MLLELKERGRIGFVQFWRCLIVEDRAAHLWEENSFTTDWLVSIYSWTTSVLMSMLFFDCYRLLNQCSFIDRLEIVVLMPHIEHAKSLWDILRIRSTDRLIFLIAIAAYSYSSLLKFRSLSKLGLVLFSERWKVLYRGLVLVSLLSWDASTQACINFDIFKIRLCASHWWRQTEVIDDIWRSLQNDERLILALWPLRSFNYPIF